MSRVYIPMKTSECQPFIEVGTKIKSQGRELEVTKIDGRYFTAEDEPRQYITMFDFKYDKCEIGIPSDAVMAELKACGALLRIKTTMLDSAEKECDELINALRSLVGRVRELKQPVPLWNALCIEMALDNAEKLLAEADAASAGSGDASR